VLLFLPVTWTSHGFAPNDGVCQHLDDAQMSGITAFVSGSKDLTPATWSSFQQRMNNDGLSKIENIQLDAYKNTYGNK
jgi:hypothetical protein